MTLVLGTLGSPGGPQDNKPITSHLSGVAALVWAANIEGDEGESKSRQTLVSDARMANEEA